MADKKLEQRIGFAEAKTAEEQIKKESKTLNLYSQEVEFLEDMIIKLDSYKTDRQEEVKLVNSALTRQGLLYAGFI